MTREPLRIGIICYPLVGGSGILASALGQELAQRGHEIHFFSYEKPMRLDLELDNIYFHPVTVSEYKLFRYADYTLPLAVRVAEVTENEGLDIVHAHYAVPHAIAAYMAKMMLGENAFKLVTTLHGTDATLFGKDPNYRPAIEFALGHSDAITAVSESLRHDSKEVFSVDQDIEVIHNFFNPKPPSESREAMRAQLGLKDEFALLHMSNLRSVKRTDLMLDTIARCRNRERIRLVILAGDAIEEFEQKVDECDLRENVIVVERSSSVENYVLACDAGIYSSEKESFCLGILETMFGERPSVAFEIGGIPEVTVNEESGLLSPFGDTEALAKSVDRLVEDPELRTRLGRNALERAKKKFSSEKIVDQYQKLYYRIIDY